jgi:phosphatidylinositol glycan class O
VVQVKRYLEAYSTSSIGGFPAADLAHVQSLYATVQSLASKPLHQDPSQLTYLDHQFDTLAELDAKKREELVSKVTGLTKLVYGYLNYLESAADLARAQWTQFGDGWMVLGLSLLVASIVVHAVALSRAMVLPMEVSQQSPGDGSVWCNTQLGEDLRTLFPFKRMLLGCGLIGLVAAGNIFSGGLYMH